MKELYVLGVFDDEGNFIKYIRKGRNYSISGYDSIASARRGLGHSKRSGRNIKIIKATTMEVIEDGR